MRHDTGSEAQRREPHRHPQIVSSCRAAVLAECGPASGDCATSDLQMLSRCEQGTGKRESKHRGHLSRRASMVGTPGKVTSRMKPDTTMHWTPHSRSKQSAINWCFIYTPRPTLRPAESYGRVALAVEAWSPIRSRMFQRLQHPTRQ
jgi:hypothetical protein